MTAQRSSLVLRLLATLWFSLVLATACAAVCIVNVVGRIFIFLFVGLPKGDAAHDIVFRRWAGWVVAQGAVWVCFLMNPVWGVNVVDYYDIPHRPTDAKPSSGEKEGKENVSDHQKEAKVPRSVRQRIHPKGPKDKHQQQKHPHVQSIGSMLWAGLLSSCAKVQPYEEAGIAMANHLGSADGFILRACTFGWMSGCKMVYKASLNYIPIFGWTFLLSRDLAVHFVSSKISDFCTKKGTVRPMIEAARDHLGHQMTIAVFPEGMRSVDGQLQQFRHGFFQLALDTGTAIYPVALVGTRQAWAPGSLLVGFSKVYVLRSHVPITPEGKDMESLKNEVAEAMTNMTADFEQRRGVLIGLA